MDTPPNQDYKIIERCLYEWTYCLDNMLWEDCGMWEEVIFSCDEALGMMIANRRTKQERLVEYVSQEFLYREGNRFLLSKGIT